ncbi:MAG: VOC family protein [Terriglobales bacterium]
MTAAVLTYIVTGRSAFDPGAQGARAAAAQASIRKKNGHRARFADIDLCSHWSKEMNGMGKITPFLWFDDKAEEAANFYTSIFNNSRIVGISRYGEAGPGPKGAVMSVTFELEGQKFMALNGGPTFTFTPAISFFVSCENQQEVDELREKLSAGGKKDRCGWLRDKYGVSWQIIPTALMELMGDPDPKKSSRVMKAMLEMDKIDIQRLQQAYQQP